jgi:hypothetical protein
VSADEVRQIEDRRIALLVSGDVQALGLLYDDRLVYTHSTGRRDGKSEFLAAVQSGEVVYRAVEHEFDDVVVQDRMAWTTGTMRASIVAGGRPLSVETLTTSVWVRASDWKLLAFQTTAHA